MPKCLRCPATLPEGRNHVWCAACHRDYDNERYQRDRIERPHIILWRNAKLRAKRRGIEFHITQEDIKEIFPNECPVYNKPFVYGSKGAPNDWAPTLDRIDSTKGYVRDNIAVISYRANTIKNRGSVDDLKRILTWLEKQNGNG